MLVRSIVDQQAFFKNITPQQTPNVLLAEICSNNWMNSE